jgi:hypothetical protein
MRMNIGKIRRLLHQAERVLGLVEGARHGHRHHRHHGHRRRRSGMKGEVLRQILHRLR